MAESQSSKATVVGGVDTHKELHVAAIVDQHNRVLGSEYFPTTRHGYKTMLKWMRAFGQLQRVGVECTGSYGAGLLRYLQRAEVEVLEVTAPDKTDRRKRGKDDTMDAENAAHAAFANIRTVTPKSRDGMVESLRVVVERRAKLTPYRGNRRPKLTPPPLSGKSYRNEVSGARGGDVSSGDDCKNPTGSSRTWQVDQGNSTRTVPGSQHGTQGSQIE